MPHEKGPPKRALVTLELKWVIRERMKQIDQDPRDYRSQPVKGEPVFVPGAGKRVLVTALAWVIVAAVSLAFLWLISPLEPIVRGAIRGLLN